MKKSIYIILSLFLFIPFTVNAETLTYEVCDTCEYTNLNEVSAVINNISDLSDKDIIININNDYNHTVDLNIGSENNMANSLVINGNNHILNEADSQFYIHSQEVTLNNMPISNRISIYDLDKLKHIYINGLIRNMMLINDSQKEIVLNDIIDNSSINMVQLPYLIGNIRVENMDFNNHILFLGGGTINIYNSKLDIIVNGLLYGNVITNIYNSTFRILKYKSFSTYDDIQEELMNVSFDNLSSFNYSIFDLNIKEENVSSYTTVYFDKEAKLKPGDKLNLADYLDYYTEDKEIEYTIEDESIAKIENKELMGLKTGSTKVTVTTDEGHVVYNINLVVEKETIPEKIDKMTIKVPITGSKIKAWVVVVSILLFGVIGVCSYMLIKRKK